METLTLERVGPVLWVWLDRPEKRNPLSGLALQELVDVFTAVSTSEFDVGCVVLGGRGPSFCGGADRSGNVAEAAVASSGSARERRWVAQLGRRAALAIDECEVPTVARLHGHVVGGGAVLAAACDFRVGTPDTSFWIPEVDLGIPLTWGAVPLLVREIGMARAREAVVLCDRIGAVDAERWGLLHRVVDAAALDDEVASLAARLAGKPEVAMSMTTSQLRAYGTVSSLGSLAELDGDLLSSASRSAEARRAFGAS